jgi:tetratricopeptide (TPR) repeat protein
MTSLAVFFALLSMNAWLSGRNFWQNHEYAKAVLLWVFGTVFWILGLLSKEHVAIVPILILIHELFLFRKGDFSVNWRLAGLPVLLGAVLVYHYLGTSPWLYITSAYEHRDYTLAERLMTQSRVLWHYLSLFFFPVAERFVFLYDYPISRGLFRPVATIVSILSWLGMFGIAWHVRKRWPVFTWMLLCFITAHLIESSVIPLEMVYEHRMYFPSLFLTFGTTLIVADFFSQNTVKPKIRFGILMMILLILGFATYTRNLDFKDAETVYRSDLEKFPENLRVRQNLALTLFTYGDSTEGGMRLKQLASEYPYNIPIQINWHLYLDIYGNSICKTDNTESVYQRIRQAVIKGEYNKVNDSVGLKNMAKRFMDSGDYEKTLFLLDRLLLDFSHYDSIWFLKGRCHARAEEWQNAVSAFRQAWKINPEDPPILYWLGKSLIQNNEHDEGCRLLKTVSRNQFNQEAAVMSQELIKEECP